MIHEKILPRLTEVFSDALGESPFKQWGLELAEDDPDGLTLLFRYPPGLQMHSPDETLYVLPAVRLEFSARSEHWPSNIATVTPYAATDYPEMFKESGCEVLTLAAERTFWEKATELHKWHHAPEARKFRDRQSRHYYDIVKMYEHEIGKAAVEDTDLLQKVSRHKDVFFYSGWARYSDARPPTLRLVPPSARLPELETDYRKMQEMIFGEPPTFESLLEVLSEIERRVNGE